MSNYDWLTKDPKFREWIGPVAELKGMRAEFTQDADGKWTGTYSSKLAHVRAEGHPTREAAEADLLSKLKIVMHELGEQASADEENKP